MKKRILMVFPVWFLIWTICLGCGSGRILSSSVNRKDYNNEPVETIPSPATNTTITKAILRERLSRRNVELIENSMCDKSASSKPSDPPEPKSIQTADDYLQCKPNPLTLEIKIISSYKDSFKAKLNNEEFNFDDLVARLKLAFKQREENGVFREGTNEIEKRINLAATDEDIADYERARIMVEDFEKLIDDLRANGIDEISVNFVHLMPFEILSSAPADSKSVPKTISGGVVNGKAVNLVQPSYPAAAKAVKASGAVNVQVTIDESGNVESAEAVSGHPLLRQAAVQAARASKFSITKLGGQPVKVNGIVVYNFKPE